MKKLLSLLLVLVFALGVIASCGPKENEALIKAGDYINALYKDESTNTTVDYDVVANVVYDGVTYPITWTVDVTEGVTIEDSVNAGFKTIKVVRGDADIAYKLTASITDGTTTITKTFDRVVPAKVSQAAIVEAAYQLAAGDVMDGTQTLTGVITKIDTAYSDSYKNITVTIVVDGLSDKPIMCYRLKGDNAADLKIGDTITVEGTIKNYNGTIEFDAGCTIKAYTAWVADAAGKVDIEKTALTINSNIAINTTLSLPATGATYTDVAITWTADGTAVSGDYIINLGDEARTITLVATLTCEGTDAQTKTFTINVAKKPSYVVTKVETPVVGTAYKMALNQETIGKFLYFNGGVSSGFLTTTEVATEAVDVTIELVAGTTDQYRITFMDGTTKKYVEIFLNSESKVRFQIVDAATMAYTWDATNKTYVATITEKNYYIGAYSNFETFSASGTNYITNAGNFTVGYYTLVDAASTPAADKIANEKDKLTVTTDITTAEVTVPVIGADYGDVTITWTSSDPAVVQNGSKLNVTLPATAGFKKVTLTATIACEGGTSQTKEFNVVLWKLPTTEAEIVSVLYALEKDMTIPGKYSLTGVITEIDAAYSTQYNNISVWIAVGGDTAHPVLVYRAKDNANNTIASVLKVGDTITVENGSVLDYNTKKEISQPTITSYTAWTPSAAEKVAAEKNALTVNTNVLADKTIALPAVGATFADVVITWTADGAPVSGNYSVTLGDEARTITLVATLTNGSASDTKTFTLEVAKKPTYILSKVEAPVVGTPYKMALNQETVGKFLYFKGSVTTGNNSGFLETTEAAAEAVDVTIELVAGTTDQFRITFMDGTAKKYVEIFLNSSSKVRFQIVDTPTMAYAWDATNKTYVATIEGKGDYYIGTYSNFETFSASGMNHFTEAGNFKVEYYQLIDEATIPDADKVTTEKAALNVETNILANTTITLPAVGTTYTNVVITWTVDGAPVSGNYDVTLGDDARTITLVATITSGQTSETKTFTLNVAAKPAEGTSAPMKVESPTAGNTYKMTLNQKTIGKFLYFKGTVNSNGFLETTENIAEAVDVTIELVAGTTDQFRITFMDGTTKKYVEMFLNGSNQARFQIVDAATMAYAWDANNKTFTATLSNSKTYYIGTYNNFNTLSASETSYLTNAGNFKVEYYQMVSESSIPAADKVAIEKDVFYINVPTSVDAATEITLTNNTKIYDDVVITWTATGATIDGNKVSLAPAAAEQTVTLTATFTIGTTSVTKDYVIVVAALPNEDEIVVSKTATEINSIKTVAAGSTSALDENASVTFNKGEVSSAPKLHTNGYLLIYQNNNGKNAGNGITFKVGEGYQLEKIVLTKFTNGQNAQGGATLNVVGGTVTADANGNLIITANEGVREITITCTGTDNSKDRLWIGEIKITYSEA